MATSAAAGGLASSLAAEGMLEEQSLRKRWTEALAACPVVAILRGVQASEAVVIGRALAVAGLRIIEVPLNSADALRSIRSLRDALPEAVVVGAGTVLTPEDVERVLKAGGSVIVSPNWDADVIKRTKALGLISFPGVATPSEALSALRCGADALKVFPGEQIPPKIIKAWRAILPPGTCLMPVGGVTESNMKEYMDAGASGFGVGTSLFKPGDSEDHVMAKAAVFLTALNAARGIGTEKGGAGSAKRQRVG